jgi:transcriptional regulator of arginine metabolism
MGACCCQSGGMRIFIYIYAVACSFHAFYALGMAWRTLITELIDSGSFRTQRELVRAIQVRTGKRVNQASVSRELTTLGARKVDGVYRIGPELEMTSRVHSLISTAGGCLVVLRVDLAFASVVAQAIDAAEMEGVLGTIAGDDTVFVATTGPDAVPALRALLGLRRS